MKLSDRVLKGDVPAPARLIRCLEDEVSGPAEELESVYLHTGRAHILGVTGAPGAGKSTLLGCLIGIFRKKGMKVGVVAVDAKRIAERLEEVQDKIEELRRARLEEEESQ